VLPTPEGHARRQCRQSVFETKAGRFGDWPRESHGTSNSLPVPSTMSRQRSPPRRGGNNPVRATPRLATRDPMLGNTENGEGRSAPSARWQLEPTRFAATAEKRSSNWERRGDNAPPDASKRREGTPSTCGPAKPARLASGPYRGGKGGSYGEKANV